jgi:hypothetical protein
MNNGLMLEFTVGGGVSPAASELLQIYQDGTALYLVGNALPLNEAGLYQAKLSPSELAAPNSFTSGRRIFKMSETYGPVRGDSGFQTLSSSVGNEKRKVKWGTFAKIPGPLSELQTVLFDIIHRTRQHPLQTIAVFLDAISSTVETGQTFRLEFSMKNRGAKSVPVLNSPTSQGGAAIRLYAATTADNEAAQVLSFYQAARPVAAIELAGSHSTTGTVIVSPGEVIRIGAQSPFVLERCGSYRLYGFFEPTIEVTLTDEPFLIKCCVMTEPVTLIVT